MVNEPTATASCGRSRSRGRMQPASDGRASVGGGPASRGGRPVDRRSGCGEGGSDAAARRGRPAASVPDGARVRFGVSRSVGSRGGAWRPSRGRRTAGWRGRSEGACAVHDVACSCASLPFAGGSARAVRGSDPRERGVVLPRQGTYAPTDNVVKSDREPSRRVRSHGNPPISGLLRMVAVTRSRIAPVKFANRFGAGSVAHDSSSGACAPPHRTAATAHLRNSDPVAERATGPVVREPHHGGS